MKKKFLTGLLAATILLSGCGGNNANNKLDFEKTEVEGPQAVPVEVKTGFQISSSEIIDETNNAEKKDLFTKAASNRINWKKAPRFNNQVDLAKYIKSKEVELEEEVPVVLTEGFMIDFQSLIDTTGCWAMSYADYGGDDETSYILFELTLSPGERVAYAYNNDDTSFLDDEELELYDRASEIVAGANEFSANNTSFPALYKELYIHDAITENTTYYTENPQPVFSRFQTAVGALLDGKANCQGYSDAFYMLAKMCGDVNVDKVYGMAGVGGGKKKQHVWNTINFGDDRYYFVDVTWDDESFKYANTSENTYVYFNAPVDVASATHNWDKTYFSQNFNQNPDGRYFFYTQEFDNSNGEFFGAHSDTAEDALNYIAKRIVNDGWKISCVCAPYDERYKDLNTSIRYLENLLGQYGWRGKFNVNISWRGGYLFFTVDATPS